MLESHVPPPIEFGERLADVGSVEGVATSLIDLAQEVQNVEIALEGENLDYEAIEDRIDGLGGTVHSVDQVACGTGVVDDRRTLRGD